MNCVQCGQWVATWEDSWQCEHGWHCDSHGSCSQCELEDHEMAGQLAAVTS